MNNPHHGARPTVHSREQSVARVASGQDPARVSGRLAAAALALSVHLRQSVRMIGAAIAAKLGLARPPVARWLRR